MYYCHTIYIYRKRKCQRLRAATHSGTLASKICNAHPQAATIATPPARLCQLRLHIVSRCAPVYMYVCDLVMAHIYTHTHVYTSVPLSKASGLCTVGRKSRWETNEISRGSESWNTFLFYTSDYSKGVFKLLLLFYLVSPKFQGSTTCCSYCSCGLQRTLTSLWHLPVMYVPHVSLDRVLC